MVCRNEARNNGATSGFVKADAEKRPDSSVETFGSRRPTAPSTLTPTRRSALPPLLPCWRITQLTQAFGDELIGPRRVGGP